MRNHRNGKSVATLVAALLLGTLAAAAAPPPGPLNGRDPARVASRLLQLSDPQLEQWRAILDAREEAIRPIAREVQGRERELRLLLDGDVPDPLEVGNLVLQIEGFKDEIEALREASGDRLLDTLGADQLELVRPAAEAAPLLPAIHSFRALSLI